MANANKLTLFIVIFMLMGILSGAAIHAYATPTTVSARADNITLLTDLFLRLIKMVIAPLVFSTLTVGIMRLGETATIGRVGGKAMVWFITSSVLSILVGLVIVTFQHPGAGLNGGAERGGGYRHGGQRHEPERVPVAHYPHQHHRGDGQQRDPADRGVLDVLRHRRRVAGEKFNAPLVAALNVVSHIMLKVTGYVMYVAPLAIFAAISSVIASRGWGSCSTMLRSSAATTAVLLTSAVLIAVGYMVLKKVFRLLNMLKDPVLVAFTTSSSEAAYPKTLERLVKFGCSRNIVSFVLPIGYSFNLVGSMVYCSFAAMFIARAYNVPLSFSEITVMMLTLMLASKGIAGVPRSALVVLAATIPSFNIPVAGILLLMGIDHFLDMGRSAINVLGNGIATAMLSKNEGLLTDEEAQPDWEVEKAEA